VEGLAHTWRLFRFGLKRDRWLIPLCVLGLIAWAGMYLASFKGLYGTPAELHKLAASMEGNAAVVAMLGPARGLDTLPGVVVWEQVPVMSIVSGVFALFLVTRHTRLEEEDGRADLVLASGAGRIAPLAAALALTALTLLLAAVGEALLLIIGGGFDPGQSVLAAAAILGAGLTFTGTAAICAQVTSKARLTRGLVGGVIGVAGLLRAIGDLGSGHLTWASPLGWAELTHPFSGGRWWVLLLPLAATVVTVAAAVAIIHRRDIGAGLIQPRPGPRHATGMLVRPAGLSLRLQRGTIIGWTLALGIYGLVHGSMGNSIEGMLDSSPALKEAFLLGDTSAAKEAMVSAYFASLMVVMAIMAAAFTISAALRPHYEEARGRTELLLASPLGRVRWAAGHILIGAIASLAIMVLLGIATGVGFGISTGDFGRVWPLVRAAAVQAPAMWVMGGITVLLFGISDRLANVAWGPLAAAFAIWTMTAFGNLPDWVIDLSPFTHTPLVPFERADPVPLVTMTLIAAALAAAGLAFFRRRDLA